MNVGAALKAAREEAGLLQVEFAKRADLDTSYVSLLENNRKSPTLTVFFRICAVLGISPSQMMKRIEVMPTAVSNPKKRSRKKN